MGLEEQLMRSLCDAFCGLGSSECVDACEARAARGGLQGGGVCIYGFSLSALSFSFLSHT